MITLLIFILMVAAFLLTFKHKKTGITTLGFALIIFFATGTGWIPSLLLSSLQTSYVNLPLPQWKKQNAIILLGAGTIKLPVSHTVNPTIMAYSRINETAQLYHACVKTRNRCTIVLSGGDAAHTGQSEALVYQAALIHLGIKPIDIIQEPNSMNTYKNAEFTSAILKKEPFDQVILVTSGIHLKRALLYFSHFGVYAKPAMADYLTSPITFIPLGYNLALGDFAVHEYIGIARFHMYNFLHWNKEVVSAGMP